MADRDIAIVGGGIGGSALAVALDRQGIDTTIFERTDDIHPVGAGISVAPNAMAVLDRLGLAKEIESRGVRIDHAVFSTAGGRTLLEYDLGTLGPEVDHPLVLMHRGKLHEVLIDAVPSGSFHLDMECTGIEHRADRAVARFEDGGELVADIIVGADGIRSTVRQDLFPDESLRPADQTAYRGIAPMELPESLHRTGREIWGDRSRFGFAPVDSDRVYWYAVVSESEADRGAERTKEDLHDRYRPFPEPTAELVGRTPAVDVIQTKIHDIDPPDRFWDRRMVLIGDAAHAATPDLAQGAAQAIEDAFVLADKLAAHEDHTDAFRAYQHVRGPRTRRIVRDSRRFGRLAHLETRPLVTVRDLLLRLVPRPLVRRQLKRTFSPSI